MIYEAKARNGIIANAETFLDILNKDPAWMQAVFIPQIANDMIMYLSIGLWLRMSSASNTIFP